MDLSEDQRHDLDVALGPPPDDHRVQLILGPVGRVAASLRNGRADNDGAPVEEFALEEFAAGGVRWWDGLYANDPRTAGHGIAPLAGNGRTR
jgi:hypothetical protein